jgi:alanine-glyoxylate transaminase / serine-glyoxylate transaminase / serine-pyruvate transaminase
MDFRMDEWGVDLGVSGSQKGFMLPTGLAIAASPKAFEAHRTAKCPRSFYDFVDMIRASKEGYFQLMRGLRASLDMLFAKGLDNVFACYQRIGEDVRAAVAAWGLTLCAKQLKRHSNPSRRSALRKTSNSDYAVKTAYHRCRLSLGGPRRGLPHRPYWPHERDHDPAGVRPEMAMRDVGVPAAGSGMTAVEEHFRAAAPKLRRQGRMIARARAMRENLHLGCGAIGDV